MTKLKRLTRNETETQLAQLKAINAKLLMALKTILADPEVRWLMNEPASIKKARKIIAKARNT